MDIIFTKEIIGVIGIIVTLIGYAAYIASIYKGNTTPHPFSWFIWATLTAIGFIAQISDDAGFGAYITGLSALLSFSIIAYIKREKIVITRNDWITFWAALAAIPLWVVTQTPLWSVILITAIDALGFYPTFYKTWFKPYEELGFQYALAAIKFVFGIYALSNFTIITVLYPLSLVIMNGLFLMMMYYRRMQIPKPPTRSSSLSA